MSERVRTDVEPKKLATPTQRYKQSTNKRRARNYNPSKPPRAAYKTLDGLVLQVIPSLKDSRVHVLHGVT